jgi:hypothetical protein
MDHVKNLKKLRETIRKQRRKIVLATRGAAPGGLPVGHELVLAGADQIGAAHARSSTKGPAPMGTEPRRSTTELTVEDLTRLRVIDRHGITLRPGGIILRTFGSALVDPPSFLGSNLPMLLEALALPAGNSTLTPPLWPGRLEGPRRQVMAHRTRHGRRP